MAQSAEDLRRALSRIRENLERRSAAKAAPVPVSAPQAPPEAPPAAPAEAAPKPIMLETPEREEQDEPAAPAAPRRAAAKPPPSPSLRPWARAAGLAAAALGAVLHVSGLLAAGLLILLAETAAGLASAPKDSRELEDVLLRLERLERRASEPASVLGAQAASPQLQEELRELRGMVKSLYEVLQRPGPGQSRAEETPY